MLQSPAFDLQLTARLVDLDTPHADRGNWSTRVVDRMFAVARLVRHVDT